MSKWDEFDPLYDDINLSEKIKSKICSKCGKSKPITEFHKNKYNKDGLAYSCKVCRRKRYLEKKEVKMLTLQKLNEMKPGTIFAKGEIIDSPEGLHMARTGRMLRWLAVRGGVNDWTIYCHFADSSFAWIRDYGDKVYGEQNIKRLVPCDDEAFERYRN